MHFSARIASWVGSRSQTHKPLAKCGKTAGTMAGNVTECLPDRSPVNLGRQYSSSVQGLRLSGNAVIVSLVQGKGWTAVRSWQTPNIGSILILSPIFQMIILLRKFKQSEDSLQSPNPTLASLPVCVPATSLWLSIKLGTAGTPVSCGPDFSFISPS